MALDAKPSVVRNTVSAGDGFVENQQPKTLSVGRLKRDNVNALMIIINIMFSKDSMYKILEIGIKDIQPLVDNY